MLTLSLIPLRCIQIIEKSRAQCSKAENPHPSKHCLGRKHVKKGKQRLLDTGWQWILYLARTERTFITVDRVQAVVVLLSDTVLFSQDRVFDTTHRMPYLLIGGFCLKAKGPHSRKRDTNKHQKPMFFPEWAPHGWAPGVSCLWFLPSGSVQGAWFGERSPTKLPELLI